jgi:uncharacterized lipoprotein YmbA
MIIKLVEKSICIISSVFLLSSCSFQRQGTEEHFYNIVCDKNVSKVNILDDLILDFRMPSYLNSKSILFKKNENEMILTNNNKWIDTLSVMLIESLSQELQISNHCGKITCPKLNINMHDFSGSFLGKSYVSYDWSLTYDSNYLCAGTIRMERDLVEKGYASLVNSLNKSWNASVDEMSSELQQCLAKDK